MTKCFFYKIIKLVCESIIRVVAQTIINHVFDLFVIVLFDLIFKSIYKDVHVFVIYMLSHNNH